MFMKNIKRTTQSVRTQRHCYCLAKFLFLAGLHCRENHTKEHTLPSCSYPTTNLLAEELEREARRLYWYVVPGSTLNVLPLTHTMPLNHANNWLKRTWSNKCLHYSVLLREEFIKRQQDQGCGILS